ncbi:MAG TPA: sigma-70 family RNA polymerase sigma factor [Polyangiaceae bacterium]|nr:sigma-70 family RNA polymerase sigma factor [Polyangiaceae bacterium]
MPTSAADRDALLPAIAAGDTRAFAVWLRDAEPRVRSSLARFARVVDTEAILQEALLRIWQVAGRVQLDGRGDTLVRLAIQIAHNLAIDHVRRDRRLAQTERAQLEAFTPGEVDDSPPPDPLLREVITNCLENLPKQPSAALHARLENAGIDPDETLANRLGMQLNTFLKNFGRARTLLLDCLRSRGVSLPRKLLERGSR